MSSLHCLTTLYSVNFFPSTLTKNELKTWWWTTLIKFLFFFKNNLKFAFGLNFRHILGERQFPSIYFVQQFKGFCQYIYHICSGKSGHEEDSVAADVREEGEGLPRLEGDEGGAEGAEEPHLLLQAGGRLLCRAGQAGQVSQQSGWFLLHFLAEFICSSE